MANETTKEPTLGKTIFVQTQAGHTYDFHNVRNIRLNHKTELTFEYFGKRTQKWNKACFINIAGYLEMAD